MITVRPIVHESVEGDIHELKKPDVTATLTLADVENGLSVVLTGQKVQDFNTALQRALNTWDVAPRWLFDLADLLDQHHIKIRRESAKTT